MIDPQSLPLWLNLVLFTGAAVVIWIAGTRLATYAEQLSGRTGLGEAFVGVVFLAIATSLPEIASTVTASSGGDAPLAVNNLLGGIVLLTAILAIADHISGGKALTHFVARSVLLLEAALVVALLGITVTGIGVGDLHGPFGIGAWPPLLFGGYLLGIYLVQVYRQGERWQPTDVDAEAGEAGSTAQDDVHAGWSTRRLSLAFGGGSLVILVAGTVVGRTGEALAGQSGLGGSFIGVTLLALATSLPELSSTIAAARIGAYSLAISNIFGTTMLLPALLFPVDIAYRSGPILDEVGRSATFAAGIGIVVTAIYLAGLVEHRNRTVAGIGLDSAAVGLIFSASLIVQYLLR